MSPGDTARRVGWARLLVVALTTAACGPGAVTVSSSPTPTPTPTPAPSTDVSSEEPTAAPGPFASVATLPLDAFPVLADEGVAIETTDGVVFIGMDGTVLGRLADTHLDRTNLGDDIPGLVGVWRAGSVAGAWVDPRHGGSLDILRGTPVGDDLLLVNWSESDPGVLTLDVGNDVYGIAASPMTEVHLSARHRVLSWTECGDAATLSTCPRVRVADFDTAETTELPTGCWVSDTRADSSRIVTCFQHWREDVQSWLEISTPGRETIRVDMPMSAGSDETFGHFVSGQFGGPGIVAQLSLECEIPHVIGIDDGTVVGLFGQEWDDGPDAFLLGVTSGGEPVVKIDGPTCGDPDGVEPGIYRMDAAQSLQPVVVADGIEDAQMWTAGPNLPAIIARDPQPPQPTPTP